MSKLVRLRANPKLIRVSIMKFSSHIESWRVIVTDLKSKQTIVSIGTALEETILSVLELASKARFPGIDLNMEWTYEHPWLMEGQ